MRQCSTSSSCRCARVSHRTRLLGVVCGSQQGQPDAVLIFGPGEAKLELKERLSRSAALAERIVGIETTDKLTDPQIVAKVKEHYGIDRRRLAAISHYED